MEHLKGNAAEKVMEAYLALQGWPEVHVAGAVRERLPNGNVLTRSHDLFGCFDAMAVDGRSRGYTVWAIQVTTPNNRAARRKKVQGRRWPASWRISVVVVLKAGALLVEDLEDADSSSERWSKQQEIVFSIARAKTALAFVKAAKKKRGKKKPTVLDGAAQEAKKRKETP